MVSRTWPRLLRVEQVGQFIGIFPVSPHTWQAFVLHLQDIPTDLRLDQRATFAITELRASHLRLLS